MKFRHEIRYDAPPEDVYAMLADSAFRERSCDAMGVLSHEITVQPDGPGMRVVIDQVQPTAGVPSFAKVIIGETTRAIQTEQWRDHRQATLTIRTPGKPVEIHGTLTLTPLEEGTVEAFEGEAKAKVPLIGGRLESVAAGLFSDGMDKEHTAGTAWLAGGRR